MRKNIFQASCINFIKVSFFTSFCFFYFVLELFEKKIEGTVDRVLISNTFSIQLFLGEWGKSGGCVTIFNFLIHFPRSEIKLEGRQKTFTSYHRQMTDHNDDFGLLYFCFYLRFCFAFQPIRYSRLFPAKVLLKSVCCVNSKRFSFFCQNNASGPVFIIIIVLLFIKIPFDTKGLYNGLTNTRAGRS